QRSAAVPERLREGRHRGLHPVYRTSHLHQVLLEGLPGRFIELDPLAQQQEALEERVQVGEGRIQILLEALAPYRVAREVAVEAYHTGGVAAGHPLQVLENGGAPFPRSRELRP